MDDAFTITKEEFELLKSKIEKLQKTIDKAKTGRAREEKIGSVRDDSDS